MTKEQFQIERTRIISEMLDNPDDNGIYPTSKCYQAFDDLYEKLTSDNTDYALAKPKLPSLEDVIEKITLRSDTIMSDIDIKIVYDVVEKLCNFS